MLNLSSGDMTKYAKERSWDIVANKFVFRSEAAEDVLVAACGSRPLCGK